MAPGMQYRAGLSVFERVCHVESPPIRYTNGHIAAVGLFSDWLHTEESSKLGFGVRFRAARLSIATSAGASGVNLDGDFDV